MKFPAVVTAILAAAAVQAAPPRVATVRVAEVYRKLVATVEAEKAFEEAATAVQKDKRWIGYQEMEADLANRRKVLQAKPAIVDETTKKRLEQEYVVKAQAAKSLLEEFELFRQKRREELTRERVTGSRKRLDELRALVEKIAADEGYDLLLDSSGYSNTGVPVMLYAKNPADLTGQVLKVLGSAVVKDEETAPASGDAPR